MAQEIPPPAPGMSPQEYYSFLNSKGIPSWQAYDATTAAYGQPRNPNEPPPPPSQANQWGQVAGLVGGAMLGSEIVGGFPTIGSLFKGGETAAIATPKLISVGAPTVGAGTGTGAGVTGIGATGAGAGTTGTATGGSTAIGTTAATTGGIAALAALGANQLWEGGMKDILRGRGTREDFINTGLALGTGGLAGIPNLALRLMGKRSIGKMMTSGKSDAQLLRDDFRGDLKASGIADENYNVTLADGSKFDIGKDGKATLTNIDGKTERRYWNVDESNPLAQYAITKIDPIIRAKYTAEAEKAGYKPEQFTAIMVNAVTSNAKSQADVDANIRAIYGNSVVDMGAPSAPLQSSIQKLPAPIPQGMTIDQMGGAIANAPSMQSTSPNRSGLSPEQNQMVEDLINRLRNQGR